MAELAGVGLYNTVDPEFTAVKKYTPETLAVAKANAAPGQTAEEYLASRGGVNAAGYYGDSWNAKQNLSDAQYAKVIAEAKAAGKTGAALGSAVNAATAKLQYDSAIASGVDPIKAAADYNASITGSNAANNQNVPLMKDSSGNVIASATKNSVTGANTSSANNGITGNAANPLDTSIADQKKADRTSAYNILYSEFDKYGLGTLVSDIKNYLIDNTFDPSEFSIQLQNTPAYQKRFAANADRIKAGLSALKPAEYIALEDQYQSLMRNYGLPETYSAKGDLGIQEGFNKLIANDVSATELEDRITTAQSRVVNADPNVLKALKAYYPDITNGDILAYTLDPKNAIDMIKRKVTSAEIGGTQMGAGLAYGQTAAEALTAAGVTQGQYAQAAPFISQATERGSQLADIYGQTPYNQAAAEAEALNLSGGAQAAAKRKKLTGLETAAFSGSSGVGALGRDKNIYGAAFGQQGQY